MPGPVRGGPKPPVTGNTPPAPTDTEEVRDSKPAAPTLTSTRPATDELVREDNRPRRESNNAPRIDTPTRSLSTGTTTTIRPLTPPPLEDAAALAGLHGSAEISEVGPETFGDAFDSKWEIVHPGSLVGLSPGSPLKDFDRPPLEGDPIMVRIKLKEPAPGRTFRVKVGGPEVSVKDAVCVLSKNSAKVLDRMLGAGVASFRNINLAPSGGIHVHEPRFAKQGDLAKAFKADQGARLELTANQDTLLHRHDGSVDTSQIDFFRDRAFDPKVRDTPSTGRPSSNEAEALIKYARKATANGKRTTIPGDTETPKTQDKAVDTSADELAGLREALAASNLRAEQAEAAAKDARIKGMLHKWHAIAAKAGREKAENQLSVIKEQAATAVDDAKAKTVDLEEALSALTEKNKLSESQNDTLQAKLEEAALSAAAAKVTSDTLIGALTSQGAALQDKLDASDAKIVALREALASHKSKLTAKSKDLKKAGKTNRAQDERITKLESELRDTEAMRAGLASDCQDLFAKTQSLETQNADLAGKLAKANKALDIARGVIVKLKADVATAEGRVSELQNQLASVQEQASNAAKEAHSNATALQDAVTRLERARDSGEETNLHLKTQLQETAMAAIAAKAASDSTIAALTAQAEKLTAQGTNQAEQISELKREVQSHRNALKQAGRAERGQDARIAKLEQDLADMEDMHAAVVGDSQELYASLESLREENAALSDELTQANKALGVARQVIVALKGDVAGTREEVQALHSELAEARSQAREAAEQARTSTTSLKQRLERLESVDAARTEEVAHLQSQLEDAALTAAANKVTNQALIASLSSEAQALQTRSETQSTRIKELEAELVSRKNALTQSGRTNEEQGAHIAKLQEDLKFAETLRRDLVSQTHELHENIVALRQDNSALSGELANANTKLGIARGVIVALKEDVAVAQREIDVLREAVTTAQQSAESIAHESRTSQANLERALSEATTDNAELRAQLQSAATDAAKVKATHDEQIQGLTGNLESLGVKISDQGDTIVALKAEIERRKQGLHEDQNVIKRQSSRITRLEGELEHAEAIRLNLVSKQDGLSGTIDALRAQNQSLGDKLKSANRALSEQGKQLVALQGKLSSAETTARATTKQLAEARAELTASGYEARRLHADLKKTVKELRQTVKSEQAKNQRLSTELELQTLAAADAQAQTEKRISLLHDKIAGLRTKVGDREDSIAELEDTLEHQRKTLRDAESVSAEQTTQLAKLACQLDGLRRNLSTTRSSLDAATDELTSTQADNDALLTEIDGLTKLQSDSESQLRTLVGILAMQGGAIDFQASELEELQNMVARYEESASAPWLTRLRGLLGELL